MVVLPSPLRLTKAVVLPRGQRLTRAVVLPSPLRLTRAVVLPRGQRLTRAVVFPPLRVQRAARPSWARTGSALQQERTSVQRTRVANSGAPSVY